MGRELQMICGIIPLPSLRSIDFELWNGNLVQDRICKPYHIEPVEMLESRKQLAELAGKGSNCPSISPWGVPVLFVRKENRS